MHKMGGMGERLESSTRWASDEFVWACLTACYGVRDKAGWIGCARERPRVGTKHCKFLLGR